MKNHRLFKLFEPTSLPSGVTAAHSTTGMSHAAAAAVETAASAMEPASAAMKSAACESAGTAHTATVKSTASAEAAAFMEARAREGRMRAAKAAVRPKRRMLPKRGKHSKPRTIIAAKGVTGKMVGPRHIERLAAVHLHGTIR